MKNLDKDIFSLIENEQKRQIQGIELIASENYVSQNVLDAAGSILTNKYAEGYPGRRYYGGCHIVDKIENEAIKRLKILFNAEYANVQPHSGSQANSAVYLACLHPGDKILGFDLSHGGHLTHGSPVNFSGKLYKPYFYGVSKETGLINYAQLKETALKEMPKMIICGASAYSRDWDYSFFRKLADEIGAILLADISHPSGLIAKGLLNDPLDFCDIITTTTHKTLRGPRGGVIMMKKDFENPWKRTNKKGDLLMMSTILNSAVFPGSQGGPLEHIIAAKAVAFREALQDDFFQYMVRVQKNAKRLSDGLSSLGYDIVSNGTDNHCILIDLRSKNITGKDAEYALGMADITVNKNMVPFDTMSPFITSGIRIGSAAITTRGMQENDMDKVVEYIDEAITLFQNKKTLSDLCKNINTFMKQFPIFKY
ncbi:MAG: serine hydroxymethyltransferase [Flavobacteriales bacterium TMED191]|nr:MAG: serine hydroxymethyltransferase [Flavobacteriales bacterium TMED191]